MGELVLHLNVSAWGRRHTFRRNRSNDIKFFDWLFSGGWDKKYDGNANS